MLIETLWVSAVVIFSLFLSQGVFLLIDQPPHLVQYGCFGAFFCILFFAIFFKFKPSFPKDLDPRLKFWIRCSLVLGLLSFVLIHFNPWTFSFALLQTLLISRQRKKISTRADIFYCFLVSWVLWQCAITFAWWETRSARIAVSGFSFLVFVISLYLLTQYFFKRVEITAVSKPRWPCLYPLLAIAIFAWASVQGPHSGDQGDFFHHWGVFVGPAEMVKQGGWLLWDVPSQYGFLNILLLAYFPMDSVWSTLFWANATFLFLSSSILFFLIRFSQEPHRRNLFPFLLSFASVFLLPGNPPRLSGPYSYPSVGPFRFFWCYPLIGVLFYASRFSEKMNAKILRYLLGCGSLAWLIGVLWSAESAVYCSAIWLLPSIFLFSSHRPKISLSFMWLFLPVILLGLSVFSIEAYYRLSVLGHGPDWSAFFDYSSSFGSGFASERISPQGAVLFFLIIFCLAMTKLWDCLRDPTQKAMIPFSFGVCGALAATGTYFVARGHENGVVNLTPIYCLVIVMVLYPMREFYLSYFIKIALIPVLSVLMTTSFGNWGGMKRLFSKLAHPPPSILQLVPVADPSLIQLLEQAHYKLGDPLMLANPILPPFLSGTVFYRAFVPAMPMALFSPLPLNRREIYFSRFIERTRLSGWCLKNKHAIDDFNMDWVYITIEKTHQRLQTWENENWRLIQYQLSKPISLATM